MVAVNEISTTAPPPPPPPHGPPPPHAPPPPHGFDSTGSCSTVDLLTRLSLTDILSREDEHQLIPGLSDDTSLRCLAKLSHGYHGKLAMVSTRWNRLICSSEYANFKAKKGWCGDWLFVLTEQSQGQWVAYDPEAGRWHPLPKITGDFGDSQHFGFSSVCVQNQLLVIGGTLFDSISQKCFDTNQVLRFDPCKKQWSTVAGMRTPRSHFACSVVFGKVYVAGGRNLCGTTGISLAEVYDPLTDKWEELPPMPVPQVYCLGLSYRDKFLVLGDQEDNLSEVKMSQAFDPSLKKWTTMVDIWPFSMATQFAALVMGGQVYAVVDGLIKTRDIEGVEWYSIGSVPAVILKNRARALETFACGFASLRGELYLLGGKALKSKKAGVGMSNSVRLGLVRVCDPKVRPLKWKETQMCGFASGLILGCASLEEEQSM